METRMINRKPCLSEKSLMEEADLTPAVFEHVLRGSQAPCYGRDGEKWYPLPSVLMVMSAAGFPRPDYNKIAAVVTEMLEMVSPEKEKLDEIFAILTRNEDRKRKITHQDIRSAEPVKEEKLLMQVEAGKVLGLSRTQISDMRKKYPDLFPQRKGKRGAWLYTKDEIEALRPLAEEVLRKKDARIAREERRAEKIRSEMHYRGVGVESPFDEEMPFSDKGSPFSGLKDVFS